MRIGQVVAKIRTKRSPDFSITRRDPALTAIVEAWTRRAPSSVNALSTKARDPSLA